MRGRIPKPNALKAAMGTRESRINPNEPSPADAPPIMPDWLDDEAKRHWELTLPRLLAMRAVAESDSDELARYCSEMGSMIRNKKLVDEEGEVIVLPNGISMVNPRLTIYRKALAEAAKHGARLGLNPTNRGSVHAIPAKPKAAETPAMRPVLKLAN